MKGGGEEAKLLEDTKPSSGKIHVVSSGVATIEAIEAAALVKMLNNTLSRPEFWQPGFSTQTLLDSITVPHIIESMAVVLSRAGAHGDTVITFQLLS